MRSVVVELALRSPAVSTGRLGRSRLILSNLERPITTTVPRLLRGPSCGLDSHPGLATPGTEISRSFATLRRRRPMFGQKKEKFPAMIGMMDPLVYEGKDGGEYTDMANLSPWTPVPDSAARRIFDIADPTEEDIHVELGCGDGRVNYAAIEFGVMESIGFDVDESILKIANDRLERIYPQPNLSFIATDLMDHRSKAWDHVKRATILTMYFARDGLIQIRPFLEAALSGRRCKIFTCGYQMPEWAPQHVETVLDIPIYMYDWNNPDNETAALQFESFLETMPKSELPSAMERRTGVKLKKNKWAKVRKIIPGFSSEYLRPLSPEQIKVEEGQKWVTEKERLRLKKEEEETKKLGATQVGQLNAGTNESGNETTQLTKEEDKENK